MTGALIPHHKFEMGARETDEYPQKHRSSDVSSVRFFCERPGEGLTRLTLHDL